MNLNKIYFDTNIVLDIIDSTRINHKSANILLKFCIFNNYKIIISEDMLSTIFYIQKDKKQVLEFLKVIQNDWDISTFGKEIISNAIELSLNNTLDLEDILQCLCAKENGCKILITNDNKFYDCGLSIFTAEEFLNETS
ncbi:MAG: PIN domain-containing protein [Helicobacteraceae bacterium]|nr:PIN domain-containing protein [Helicobacteraceae bacterium]